MTNVLGEILKIACGNISVVATDDHHFCLKSDQDEADTLLTDYRFIAPPMAFCDIEKFYRVFECLYEHLIFLGFRDVRDKDYDPPLVSIKVSDDYKICHPEMTKWLNDFHER